MGEWISVNKRLPDVDERVIVFGVGKMDGFIGDTIIAITSMSDRNPLATHIKCEKHWRSPWQYFLTDYEITHWMPLPEPPKEGQIMCNGDNESAAMEQEWAMKQARKEREYQTAYERWMMGLLEMKSYEIEIEPKEG